MKIEYYHASKYGNGAKVAEEFKEQMTAKGITVNVHHVKDAKPKEIPSVDLYLFSSPGRFGKPIGDMQHFLKKANLPAGTKYAVIVTELCPKPDSSTERIPTDENTGKCQRVIPIMKKCYRKRVFLKLLRVKFL